MKYLSIIVIIFIECSVAHADIHIDMGECVSCHFDSRSLVSDHFPTGFGKWDNSQCYGCHEELTEVSLSYLQGKKDKRFSSLPMSDSRIHKLENEPLPYLNAPKNPLVKAKNQRMDSKTLQAYLTRPHGKCMQNGTCEAPKMMAYPMNEPNISMEILIDDKKASLGGDVFKDKCQNCHEYSGSTGYDAVGLSLFSQDWILFYSNMEENKIQGKTMPAVPINEAQSAALYHYFQKSRDEREQKTDRLVHNVINNFQNQNNMLPANQIEYMWSQFWRDSDCVHCHSIGGRAGKAFDTNIDGIVSWLSENDPRELVDRTLTRLVEEETGMAAEIPGMPMSGKPLTPFAITLLDTWIKMGCPDTKMKLFCKKQK